MPRTACASVIAGAVLAVAEPSVALALSSAEETSDSPRADNATGLTEVVVTAERQSENLQRVPITVTAFEAESLAALGVSGTADLPSVTPGLVLAPQFGYAMFHLRGVGTYNNVGGNESSNALYVDDLYIPDMPAAFLMFNGIERIEVLKGPQGTLFGRNATGGLIHVITREPQSDPAADISVGYANFATIQAETYLTAGTGRAAADLAALYRNQSDGWGRNVFSGDEFFEQRLYALRSKQRFDLANNTRVVTSLFYTDDWNTYSSGRRPIPGTLGIGGTPYPGGFFNIDFDSPAFAQFSGGGASLTLTHDAPWGTFVAISGYQRNAQGFEMDQDSTPNPVVAADIDYRNRYFTQELQVRSPAQQRLTWVGGLYFLDGRTDLERALLQGAAFTGVGGSQLTRGEQRTASYAVYAQLTMPAGEATRVTGGLRFTDEHRHLDGQVSTPLNGVAQTDTGKTWGAWSWRLSLDRALASDVMGYASYSRGFKSGVYNLLAPTNPAVNPETLDAFELGLKTEWLDRVARVNASSFYYVYDNLQLLTARLGVNTIINAAAATIYGVDVDAAMEVTPGLVLRAQAEWLHTRYDSFENAPAQVPAPGTCTPFPHTTGPLIGGNITCSIDAAGNRLTSAPAFTSAIGAHYEFRASFGRIAADLAYYRTSSIFFQPDNRLRQPEYGLLSASLGFESRDGRFEVRVWGKNLTDEQYAAFITASTGDAANPGAPRTFGITLQAHL